MKLFRFILSLILLSLAATTSALPSSVYCCYGGTCCQKTTPEQCAKFSGSVGYTDLNTCVSHCNWCVGCFPPGCVA
jgi:hypothetical protein